MMFLRLFFLGGGSGNIGPGGTPTLEVDVSTFHLPDLFPTRSSRKGFFLKWDRFPGGGVRDEVPAQCQGRAPTPRSPVLVAGGAPWLGPHGRFLLKKSSARSRQGAASTHVFSPFSAMMFVYPRWPVNALQGTVQPVQKVISLMIELNRELRDVFTPEI